MPGDDGKKVTALGDLQKLWEERHPQNDDVRQDTSRSALVDSALDPAAQGATPATSDAAVPPAIQSGIRHDAHEELRAGDFRRPEYVALETEFSEIRRDLDEASAALDRTNMDLERAVREISDLQQSVMSRKAEISDYKSQLLASDKVLLRAERQLKQAVADRAKAINAQKRQSERAVEKKHVIDGLNADIAELQKESRAGKRKLARTLRENSQLQASAARTSKLELSLKWLGEGLGRNVQVLHPQVVLFGEMPFPAVDFVGHLRARAIRSKRRVASDVDVMVVGRTGWTEIELESQIYARQGKALRVYSQELALMSLAVGRDALTDASREALIEWGQDHPALAFLSKSELQWPNCHPPSLPETFEPFEFESDGVDESPLKKLGYTVGKTKGLHKKDRKAILESAFHEGLPWTHSNEYMADWGQPGTRRRLWRMAHHLAWLARSWSRMPNHQFAVADWAHDLDLMRREFFKPYMLFTWPKTRVPGRRS